jgi:hypothetical protein
LRANPDVRGMVDRGLFRSGFEHWYAVGANEHALGDRVSGFYEHDLMYDEAAYLQQNPDVAEAVRARAVRNGYQHWIRFGRLEFARGARFGPFKAPDGLFRPFRIVGEGGYLFVARAPDDFERAERTEIRVGAGAPGAVSGASVSCSKPLRLVDACGAGVTLRLLVVAFARDALSGEALLRNKIDISIQSAKSPTTVATYRDNGIPAFSFATADDANEFLAAVRASRGPPFAPVIDFTLERLALSPRAKGYEWPLTFRIERASAQAGGGVLVSGWVALPEALLGGCRAWCPGRAEFFDLTRTWARLPRPDIVQRFPTELGSCEGDRFGFQSVVRFAEPFPALPSEKVLFGVAEANQPEQWIELDLEPSNPAP